MVEKPHAPGRFLGWEGTGKLTTQGSVLCSHKAEGQCTAVETSSERGDALFPSPLTLPSFGSQDRSGQVMTG